MTENPVRPLSLYFVLMREEDATYRTEDGSYSLLLRKARQFVSEAEAGQHINPLTEHIVGVAEGPSQKAE